jgi:hypothetical protein
MECTPFRIRAALIEPGDQKRVYFSKKTLMYAKNRFTKKHSASGRENCRRKSKRERAISAAKVALKLATKKRMPLRKV